MAGDKGRTERSIPLVGGLDSDSPVAGGKFADMENLVPSSGGRGGLTPRDGVEFVLLLETEQTEGYVIHEVTLDDAARTKLLCVQDSVSREIFHIGDHTDMEGRTPLPPKGGGELPVRPVATENAVLLQELVAAGDPDSEGNRVYDADVMVWDDANKVLVGPSTLKGVSYNDIAAATVFARSKNFLVTAAPTKDHQGLVIKTWDIDEMLFTGIDHEPLAEITVFSEFAYEDDKMPVYMYRDNIAYVLAGTTIYRVDLVSGDVTSKAVTGLPGTFANFLTYQRESSWPVDSNGLLLATGTDSEAGHDWILKINPETGAVVHSKLDEEDHGFFSNHGMDTLPDGKMMSVVSKYSYYMEISDDLQTFTPTSAGSNTPFTAVSSLLSIVDGCTMQQFSAEESVARVIDVYSGAIKGLTWPDCHFAYYPCVIYHDRRPCFLGYEVVYDEGLDEYHNVTRMYIGDVDTGEIVTHDAGKHEIWDKMKWYYPIPDAWGYGVENIQGAV